MRTPQIVRIHAAVLRLYQDQSDLPNFHFDSADPGNQISAPLEFKDEHWI
jgi:hypothetical protein